MMGTTQQMESVHSRALNQCTAIRVVFKDMPVRFGLLLTCAMYWRFFAAGDGRVGGC
jgi:hypothetical protein